MKTVRSLGLALALAVGLAGCSPAPDVPAIEAQTMKLYNQELEKQNFAARCIKVTLAHESGNKYTGVADMNDGSKVSMDVVDDGAKLIFDAVPIH